VRCGKLAVCGLLPVSLFEPDRRIRTMMDRIVNLQVGGESVHLSGGTLNMWRCGDDGRTVAERLQVRF
jgi:hypothetical protein